MPSTLSFDNVETGAKLTPFTNATIQGGVLSATSTYYFNPYYSYVLNGNASDGYTLSAKGGFRMNDISERVFLNNDLTNASGFDTPQELVLFSSPTSGIIYSNIRSIQSGPFTFTSSPQPDDYAVPLALVNDTGPSAADHITRDASIQFATAGASTISYVVDSQTANAYRANYLQDGSHTVSFEARDASNTLLQAGTLNFTLDRVAPDFSLSVQAVTRLSGQDHVTASGTVEVSKGVAVHVFDGTTDLGAATVDAGGRWQLDAQTTSGTHALSAVATDAAGNTTQSAGTTLSAGQAYFAFGLVGATVSEAGNGSVTIKGPDNSKTTLSGVAHYTFSDGVVNEHAGSPLVDDIFYYGGNKDVYVAQVDATARIITPSAGTRAVTRTSSSRPLVTWPPTRT